MDVWDIWVIAALLLFIIEVFTSGYIVTCLAFGAVGGAVAAVCDLPVWAQVLSGVFVALFAFFTVRPVVRLYMHKGIKRTHTGPLVGRTVEVTEKIPAGQVGRIRLGDYEWQVLVVDGDEVGPGDRVEILKQNTDILKARKI